MKPHTHFVALDGLRGLAILLVMAYHFFLPHTGAHSHQSGWVLQLAQAGWMGVDLFFVLSGFLITGILTDTRTQPHYFKNFLGRRFLRIWPLYYLSLLGLLVVVPLLMGTVPPELQSMRDKQAWFWLYGANWLFAKEGGFTQTSGGYFWSLAVEEQFYLVWPLVVYACSTRMLLRVSLGLMACSLALRLVLAQAGLSTGALYTMTFTHLDGLAAGSALAIMLRCPALTARLLRWLPWAVGVSVLGLAAVRWADQDFFFWSRHMATWGYSFIAVVFSGLLVCTVRSAPDQRLHRFFSSGALTQCGKYSYALYMVHVPVASFLFAKLQVKLEPVLGYEGMFLAFIVTSFAVSWGLAVASWHVLEKRALRLKRYFA
jgi:peptidoglycan/LPS O-acetylase OafA/YrhL